jgi:hypothetical protein
VGPRFRVAKLQKSEEKQADKLGVPRWEELGTNVKNNRSSLPPFCVFFRV